jgi:putative transposase
VVYAKAPFRGADHLLQYLSRYTHRVAISNHRLLAFDGNSVTFRWKDYAHGNKQRKMTISTHEFLRRFLLHTLPRGFVRIRSFGFLAGPRRHAPTSASAAPGRFHTTYRATWPSIPLPLSGLRSTHGGRRAHRTDHPAPPCP